MMKWIHARCLPLLGTSTESFREVCLHIASNVHAHWREHVGDKVRPISFRMFTCTVHTVSTVVRSWRPGLMMTSHTSRGVMALPSALSIERE